MFQSGNVIRRTVLCQCNVAVLAQNLGQMSITKG